MLNRIQLWLKSHFGVCSPEENIPAIQQWFSSPYGQTLLAQEKKHIDDAISCLFGYHLCQLGVSPSLPLYVNSKINHKFILSPCNTGDPLISALCDHARLPLPAETIDVFLMHHALDFSQKPHQLLSEAAKATVARGHIVIVGFNPLSLLGLWRYFLRLVTRKPEWRQEPLPLKRLMDWLELLGLTTISIRQGYHCPTKRREKGFLSQYNLPFGGYYVLTARKDIYGATLIKPKQYWQDMEVGTMPNRAHAER